MERIGLAASKIAKGHLFFYNLYVVLIASLFSFLIFVVVGATILFALIIIDYIGKEIISGGFIKNWSEIISICMISLTIVVGSFNIFAIFKNLKFKKE